MAQFQKKRKSKLLKVLLGAGVFAAIAIASICGVWANTADVQPRAAGDITVSGAGAGSYSTLAEAYAAISSATTGNVTITVNNNYTMTADDNTAMTTS